MFVFVFAFCALTVGRRFRGPLYDLAFFREADPGHVEDSVLEETIDGEKNRFFLFFSSFFLKNLFF